MVKTKKQISSSLKFGFKMIFITKKFFLIFMNFNEQSYVHGSQ